MLVFIVFFWEHCGFLLFFVGVWEVRFFVSGFWSVFSVWVFLLSGVLFGSNFERFFGFLYVYLLGFVLFFSNC